MSRIFLSHSSANNAEAVALRDWLEREGWNGEVFLDLDATRGIAAGERWERALNQAANRCEAVLFLVSRDWIGSGWCRRELNLAHRLNKRLFGVLIEDLTVEQVPKDLTGDWQLVRLAAGRDHIVLRAVLPVTHEEIHVTFSQEGLQRLKHGLEQAGLDPQRFEWPPTNDPKRPPYRGLRPLESDDAGIFFGREAAVIEALDRLRGLREMLPPRLLVILGASGAGKSSFIRAGLLPRLMRDDRHFLPLPILRPERAAISGETGLLRAIEATMQAANVPTTRANLRASIEGGAATLRPLLQSLVEKAAPRVFDDDAQPKPPTLIISIDQGEELFLAEGQDEARTLLAVLRNLLLEDGPPLIVLLTIRSDSYERLQLTKELEGVRHETLSLPSMPRGSYAEVIKGPALRLAGTPRALKIEDSLVNALLVDIEKGGAKDSLPLLSFTLERLYAEYGGAGRLLLADYEALGRIKGSIEAAVERAFKEADKNPGIPKDRNARLALLRRGLIPWLAGIDPETGSPRRRVARKSEIPEEARPLIDNLVDQRLLATDVTTDTGEQTIEPVHEALLRQWGVLRGWLEEDFTALTTLEGIKSAARDWAANERRADWLNHAGGRLEDAEKVAARVDLAGDLTTDAREYLRNCREQEVTKQRDRLARLKQEQDEQERRLRDAQALAAAHRRTATRTGIGLVAALVLATTAAWQWWEAKTQRDQVENAYIELVDSEILALSDSYSRNGIRRLVMDIENRSHQKSPSKYVYLLMTPNKAALAGNIEQVEAEIFDKTGLFIIKVKSIDESDAAERNALVRVFQVSGGFRLLVGRIRD